MKTLIATAAAAALTLAACGGDEDISPETLTDALVDQGLERPIAECISNDLAGQLDDDDFNNVALAQSTDDMSPELQELVIEVTTACVLGEE